MAFEAIRSFIGCENVVSPVVADKPLEIPTVIVLAALCALHHHVKSPPGRHAVRFLHLEEIVDETRAFWEFPGVQSFDCLVIGVNVMNAAFGLENLALRADNSTLEVRPFPVVVRD